MSNIFQKHKEELPEMIRYVYRKLKSYIYYSNNILYAKKMIADFEYDDKKMENTLDKIASLLSSINNNDEYIENLVKKIKYKVLPKVSIEKKTSNKQIVTNDIESEIKITNVNFFIDAPIEIWILDTLWSLLIGYFLKKEGVILKEVKSNKLNDNLYTFDNEDFFKNINFKSLNTFVPYFKQYKKWKKWGSLCYEFYV